jgi:SAM-dependent methyltransferase
MSPCGRDRLLEELQTHKTAIALPLERLRAIDRHLESVWEIVLPEKGASSWEDLVGPGADPAAVERYRKAHDTVAEALRGRDRYAQVRSLSTLYDALAHTAVLGPVTSKRRPFIIDSIAVALGLSSHLHLERIIDVGCHAGTITSVLASELGRRVVGVDPSPAAIEFARAHATRGAEFEVSSVPFDSTERFDLLVSIDSFPHDDRRLPDFLKGVANLLVPNGVALIVSPDWVSNANDLHNHCGSVGLSFGYADVVGGFGDFPPKFEVEGLVVLLKGGTRMFPSNLKPLMENEWEQFRRYANDSSTPPREKTQAFERAIRRQAPGGE